MTSSRPTIRDVATLAGVSYQTVSRVINGEARVAPQTREKVEAAIATLGFRPSEVARNMALGRTRLLACLSPNLTDYTFACLIESAELEARRHGYMLVSSSAPDAATFAELVEQMVVSRDAAGLLVINPYIDERHRLLPRGTPIVFMGARPRSDAADSVALDDEGAGRTATQHLLSLGHRRLAMVSGPLVEDCSQDRTSGYQSALHAAGVSFDRTLVIEGDWSATSGYDAFMQLTVTGRQPSAVFAQNDRMAVGIIRAARDRGLRVPEDLSVIGIDDMPLASYFDPPLTTLRQDLAAIGREAAGLLLHAVEHPDSCNSASGRQRLRLSAELVVRRSTTAFH